jgi:hypothetical protein
MLHAKEDVAHNHDRRLCSFAGLQSLRLVANGKRMTELEARKNASAGDIVCVVPGVTGGGCGMSVGYVLHLLM